MTTQVKDSELPWWHRLPQVQNWGPATSRTIAELRPDGLPEGFVITAEELTQTSTGTTVLVAVVKYNGEVRGAEVISTTSKNAVLRCGCGIAWSVLESHGYCATCGAAVRCIRTSLGMSYECAKNPLSHKTVSLRAA